MGELLKQIDSKLIQGWAMKRGKNVRGVWAHCSGVGRWGTSPSPSVAPTI